MKGCLIFLGVVILFFVGVSAFLWTKREVMFERTFETLEETFRMPDDASQESIEAEYGDVIAEIDLLADSATSFFEFAAGVEQLDLGNEVLYVGAERNDNTVDIVKRFSWTGHSFRTWNKFGYGTLSNSDETKSILILYRVKPWSYMDRYLIYFERKPMSNTPNDEEKTLNSEGSSKIILE